MDPLSSLSASAFTATAASNLLGSLVSAVNPATAAFKDIFAGIASQPTSEGTVSGQDFDQGSPVNSSHPSKAHSLKELASRLRAQISKLLAASGFSTQHDMQLELSPLGSVYIDDAGPQEHSQAAMESILDGDESLKQDLQRWSSLTGSARFSYTADA